MAESTPARITTLRSLSLWVAGATLALGAILRIWQYLANTSLWIDEIAVTNSIVDRSLGDLLLRPLAHHQVAPIGFLATQKLAVVGIGPSEYALRLVPLACSLAALVLFWRLASRVLSGAGPLIAVTLFATAAPLIAFGALAKQYSSDVLIAVILLGVALNVASQPPTMGRVVKAAIIGGVLVWFSNSAVFVLTGLAVALALSQATASDRATRLRAMAPMLVGWVAVAVAATLVALSIVTVATREYMRRFWVAGFAPRSIEAFTSSLWPWDQVRGVLGNGLPAGLGYPLPVLFAVLAAGGVWVLGRRDRTVALLLLGPLVLVLAAAIAREYPFRDRLILFLLPGLLIAIAACIEWIRERLTSASPLLGTATVIGLTGLAVYPVTARPPTYRTEDMKQVVSYVAANRRPDDGIYVYYGAAPAVLRYGGMYGLPRHGYLVGGCHRGDARRYLQELDRFRGQSRVWVLFTHPLPRYHERENILHYLRAIGIQRDSLTVSSRAVSWTPLPAEAFLYDLSDAGRLSQAAAELFPLEGPQATDGRFPCGEGPQAMVASDYQ